MNVLITGGTGFVGHWVQERAPAGMWIRALNHENYDRGDWQSHKWDYIFHLAPIDPKIVLEHAKRTKARVLFASSGAVYHTQPTEYGKNKINWERLCVDSGVNCVIARLFTFCGARLNWPAFAIGQFIKDALSGGPIRVLSDGQTIRSYMYGADLGDWLWALITSGYKGNFDIGSDEPVTMIELAELVAHNFTPSTEIIIENKISVEQSRVYLPRDAQITRMCLGVRRAMPTYDAIRKSIEDYRHEN